MQPETPKTPVVTQPNTSFDKQLADIKAQTAKIVTSAQKIDPNIKISTANAEMIGLPKVNIPTQKKETPRPSELDRVGSTVLPKTSQDVAREAILSQVPEEDRDTISQILDISTGYQTERGKQLEGTAESILTQQLSNISSTRDKALESSKMKEAARLPELEAELETIRSENDVLQAQRNSAIQAEERREGVSTSARAGNVQRISRDFDLQQANLAIRELASVGKINAATKLIEAKLDLKYGDLEAETALLTAQINAISPFLDREDQKAAETRLQLNDIVKTKIADAREKDKALEEFKLQSYLFAQQNGATPATLSQIMSSESREDVASVGGSFIQDPMQKLQMAGMKADIANTYDQISDRKARLKLAQDAASIEVDTKTAEKAEIDEAKGEKALGMLQSIRELKNHPGFGSAVGPNPLARMQYSAGLGLLTGIFSGDKSEFQGEVDRLANTLTLENMGLLKGPATDKDVEIVANSMSRLKNFDVSEAGYWKELERLEAAAQRIVDNVGVTPEQASFYLGLDQESMSEVDNIFGGSTTNSSTPLINW